MNIKIDNQDVLLCPTCDFTYLHLEKVVVVARREDMVGTRIVVEAQTGTALVQPSMGGPCVWGGGRRDHAVLLFSCEGCGETSEMRFEQHKGNTYAGWNK